MTEQLAFWKSIFTIKNAPIYYNSLHLDMPKFKFKLRFEVTYWLD